MEPVPQAGQDTDPVISHHTMPLPSSCAMSSLLLLPHRAAEAAEAYGARTRLCSGLWGQKIPSSPSACQSSRLAQLMHKVPPLTPPPSKSLHLHMVTFL